MQYGFKLGEDVRATLSVNVFNLFDQDVATRYNRELLLGVSTTIPVPVDQYFAGYDYQAAIDASGTARDPRFLQANLFQWPRAVRLGVRINF